MTKVCLLVCRLIVLLASFHFISVVLACVLVALFLDFIWWFHVSTAASAGIGMSVSVCECVRV